jgi:hypothetical protein
VVYFYKKISEGYAVLMEKDWFMRQINMMVQFAAKLVFHKNDIEYEIPDPQHMSGPDSLYLELRGLIARGEIGRAEDLLFERMDKNDKRYLELALDFYKRLNDLDDDALEAGGFTREEINEGLGDVLEAFGVPNIGAIK